MSILIKGAEMPKNCHECPCMRHDSLDGLHRYQCNNKLIAFGECDSWSYERRPNWCTLVELPEKHGRLIDADDFSAVMKERQLASAKWLREAKDAETINRADAVFAVLCEVKLTIGKLPTIVEAEGERDG